MSKVRTCINWTLGSTLFLLAMVQPATQTFSQTTTVEFPKTGENVVLVANGRFFTVGFIPAELLGYPGVRTTFAVGRSLHWAHAPGKTFSTWSDLNTDDLEVFQEPTRHRALAVLRDPRIATDPAECQVIAADDVRDGPSFWGVLLFLGVGLAAINLAPLQALRGLRATPHLAVPAAPKSLREHIAHSIRSIRHFSFHRDHAPAKHQGTPWRIRLRNATRKNGTTLTGALADAFRNWRMRQHSHGARDAGPDLKETLKNLGTPFQGKIHLDGAKKTFGDGLQFVVRKLLRRR